MANAAEFAREMRLKARKLRENTDKLVRAAAIEVDQSLVLTSPVDTGRFRSNWVATVSGGFRRRAASVFSSVFGRSEQDIKGASAAMAEARARIMRYKGQGSIWISNNLPYGPRLENGWSLQAPAGMVDRAVQRGQALIRRHGSLFR